MLTGEEKDSWVKICENVGLLLATTRNNLRAMDVAKVFQNEPIG